MQVNPREILERLQKLKRPPLTDLPLEKEVPMILKKRTPLYTSVATVALPASIPYGGQIPFLTRKLQALCSW
jgi:shikimate kinase